MNASVDSTVQIPFGHSDQGVGDTWDILNDSESADQVDATIVQGSQIAGTSTPNPSHPRRPRR